MRLQPLRSTEMYTSRDVFGMLTVLTEFNSVDDGTLSNSEVAALSSMLIDFAGKLDTVVELMRKRCPSHPGIPIARTTHQNILALIDAFEALRPAKNL